jgi:L-iditol 2-dehydrogenase
VGEGFCMNALLLDEPGRLRPGVWPDEKSERGRLHLSVQVVSVCGSDIHYYKEGKIGAAIAESPFVLGHEFSAVVNDERGEEFGILPGTLVAVDPAEPCDRCEWCMHGYTNLCPNVRFAGTAPVPGALREFYNARPDELYPLPEGFNAVDGALLEPLGVAVHALDLARVPLGATVAVVGMGAIGLLIAQVAQVAGASEMHVVEPLAYRREIALRLVCDAAHADPGALIEATAGRGSDVVIEATDTPEGPDVACQVVRIGGRVVLVGIPDGDWFSLTASVARRKGLTVKFSRRMGHVYPRAIGLVAAGRVNLGVIVTHRFPLERGAEAFEIQADRRDGAVKAVIKVGSEV